MDYEKEMTEDEKMLIAQCNHACMLLIGKFLFDLKKDDTTCLAAGMVLMTVLMGNFLFNFIHLIDIEGSREQLEKTFFDEVLRLMKATKGHSSQYNAETGEKIGDNNNKGMH